MGGVEECGRCVGGWRCVVGLEVCGGRGGGVWEGGCVWEGWRSVVGEWRNVVGGVEECGGRGGGMWWEG